MIPMNTLLARGTLRGALVLAVVTAVTAVGATAAQAAAPKLTLTALSFAQSSVDVSSQSVTDDLTWTIKNTDQDAEGLFGSVTIRMRSSVTGGFLGHEQVVTFDLNSFCCNGVDPSGTPQLATFTYHFAVPQWA